MYELMLATDAVRNVIRDGRLHQLGTVLQTGQAQGQVRVDDMVRDAWLAGDITYETAHGAVTDPGVLQAARR